MPREWSSSPWQNVVLFSSLVLSPACQNPIYAMNSQTGEISTTKPSWTRVDSSVSDSVNNQPPPLLAAFAFVFLLVWRILRSWHLRRLFSSHKTLVWSVWGMVSIMEWEVPSDAFCYTDRSVSNHWQNSLCCLCGSVFVFDPWLKLYNGGCQSSVSLNETSPPSCSPER